MWRPFDSLAKRRKRFIEKNSPYLVPLAVGGLAAMGDENASTRQRLKRGLVTGGQTFAAMKTAGVFNNDRSKKNYFKNTILPGVREARSMVNTGINIKKELRSATKFGNKLKTPKDLITDMPFSPFKKRKGFSWGRSK
jgi:hypothetical protein